MKPNSLEAEYVSLGALLKARVNELKAKSTFFGGFWERWCNEHVRVVREFANREFDSRSSTDLDSLGPDFLTRRQRMVSALIQGLKSTGQDSLDLRNGIRDLIRDHDLGFVALLQKELEHVKDQMARAYTVKKTVSAYAQTVQYRGE
ncbi:MAG: hypothetical protein RI953_1410 [Pseudomonadota bacterium]|jgi:hypothetical protein